jgi:hypothetical protein
MHHVARVAALLAGLGLLMGCAAPAAETGQPSAQPATRTLAGEPMTPCLVR